jgi:hypothetical protein
MKKKFLIVMLAVAGTKTPVCSQQTDNTGFYHQRTADQLFNYPPPGNSVMRFDFIMPAGNKMFIELSNILQADSLPSINGILSKAWNDLQQLKDSLDEPLLSRRIDYIVTPADTKIRIKQYPQQEEVYSISKANNNDITQLKTAQDTFIIRLFTVAPAGRQTSQLHYQPYSISFFLNNIMDLQSIFQSGNMEAAIGLLKNDLADVFKRSKPRHFSRYYALYDVAKGKRIFPSGTTQLHRIRPISIPPYIETGIQYLRGAWSPSAGVGINLATQRKENVVRHYRLLAEPYFFFTRDLSNKLSVNMNTFVSFKYNLSYSIVSGSNRLAFYQNYSFGFLVHRRGDWFERTSFKFSLPGLQSRNFKVEPEFYFNKFFRNFSPSLKIGLYLE